ncbi:MAG: hypothetical protein AAB397_03285 [Patescibacteria group bacterium]
MKKTKKKKITLDNLAVIIKKDFNRIDERLDQMVTKEEFNERLDQMVTKEEFAVTKYELNAHLDKVVTKEEFNQRMSDLIGTLDSFIKRVEIYYQEHLVIGERVYRHDEWIRRIADKLEIKLEA